ncbi:hypothetical protein [Azospirillum endophyticum]
MRVAAFQPGIASLPTHTVRLPPWRKAASHSAQFVTFRFGRTL